MTLFNVHVSLFTLDTDVEARSEEEAMSKAVDEWVADAEAIIAGGTFTVREVGGEKR